MPDPKPVEVKKPLARLFEGDLKSTEFARADYLYVSPPGLGPDDYLEPEAYVHVLGKLNAPAAEETVVTILAEDRTWRMQVLVLGVSGQVIHVAELSRHNFQPAVGKEHDGYDTEWAGPSAKWRVLRKSDRHVMVDKLATKSDAVAWVEQNALKQAA